MIPVYSIERNIIRRLEDDANLTSLLGANKVFLEEAPPYPEKEMPYVVVERTATEVKYTASGESGLEFVDIDIDLFSKTAYLTWAIANRVRELLSGFSGVIGSLWIQNILVQGISTVPQAASRGQRDRPHGVSMEFEVQYRERVTSNAYPGTPP